MISLGYESDNGVLPAAAGIAPSRADLPFILHISRITCNNNNPANSTSQWLNAGTAGTDREIASPSDLKGNGKLGWCILKIRLVHTDWASLQFFWFILV